MINNPFIRYGSVVFLIFCLFHLLWFLFPGICSIWDLQVEDRIMRFAYSRQVDHPASPDIVHIDLDDSSLVSLQYHKDDPRLYTELIKVLREIGIETVLVDMVFPYCRKGREESCTDLASEINKAGNIYFPVILSHSKAENPQELLPAIGGPTEKALWQIQGLETLDLPGGEVTMSNHDEINNAVEGLGHINAQPDRDGVYRRLPLIINSSRGSIANISLRVVSGYLGITEKQIHISGGKGITLEGAQFPDGRTAEIMIPVDKQGRNRINFRGAWNDSFSHYSFATMINTGATPDGLMDLTDELEGTIAIISDVSTGSQDFGPIPLSSRFPLSGVHSNFINSILENDFFRESDLYHRLAFDALLVIMLIFAAAYLRGTRFILAATGLFGLMLFGSIWLFMEHRFLLPLVRPSLSFITVVPGILLMQFFEVQKKEQYIRGQLTHYFAPSLMNKILKEPELLNNVEKKELTILFSDIVGFTSWSSSKDAQDIHQTLNHYFEAMAAIVFAHHGTIDKYMGDGLMVFFGDPEPCENHALLAVKAAIEMQKKTRELRSEWERSGGMPITIRIGIHTGEVVVGNMGSKNRMEYTVIGSNVNLAQRLESNCQPGGVMLSQQTFQHLNQSVNAKPAGTIQAKGFSEPIPVYTITAI